MTFELKAYIEEWLQKAENDLISAQRLIEIEPMILDNACFHCQQAVEKSLKAFLIYNGVEIEKTHNVIFLLDACAKFDLVFATIDPKNINMYAVKGRYPDTTLMPDVAETKGMYQLAIQVNSMVKEKIVF